MRQVLLLFTLAACRTPLLDAPDAAAIDHPAFTIGAGTLHDVPCADCHTDSSNYKIFNCLTAGCHPRAQTDTQHAAANGYDYNSTKCFACHNL